MKPPTDLTVAGLAAVVASAAVASAWARHMVRRHGAGPLAWRYFSGHPLDGAHRTDATWTRPATKVLHQTGHAVRWHHLPRITRAAIRSGTLLVLAALGAGLAVAPRLTLATLAAAGCAVLILGALWTARRVRAWNHHRHYVRPLYHALTAELGVPPSTLAVEADRSRVAIGLGDEFTGGDKAREAIARTVAAKLAIEAPEPVWKLHGARPQVVFTASQPPPGRVSLADIMPEIRKAKSHEVVAGIGRKDEIVVVSVDNDSPHIGVSMGSGDGKSVLARNFLSQRLYRGALGIVLDYKLISHQWARGLPNVAYAGTAGEIHLMSLWLAGELGRRNKVALAGADIEGLVHADVGPPLFVVCEELNATQNRLAAYWKNELGGKGRSPASEALDEAMFIGRQVLCNMLQIGQRLSAKAAGSGDARENLGVKIVCDPSAATWRMLCEGLVQPPAAGHRGRYQVVSRRTVREVQGAFLTGQEARDFALSGTVASPRWDMPLIAHVPGTMQALPVGADQGNVSDNGGSVPGPAGLVTLDEAVSAGVLRRSLAAARKAAQRDQNHPQAAGRRGNANLYDVGELALYDAQKVRVK